MLSCEIGQELHFRHPAPAAAESVMHLLRFNAGSARERRFSHIVAIALSYTVFLFLALLLAMFLYFSSIRAAHRSYWDQQAMHLRASTATMNAYLDTMTNYCHQLTTDSTLVRLANMPGLVDKQFVQAAWQVMQNLNTRAYGLLNIPVTAAQLYLKESGYVISSSQFTEGEQYYRAYRAFTPGGYEAFLETLLSADGYGGHRDMSAFTGREGSVFYLYAIDVFLKPALPAVLWFELDVKAMEELFLPEGAEKATLLVTNAQGRRELLLGAQDEALAGQMASAVFDGNGMAECGDMMLLRQHDSRGWSYTLALPRSMCTEAVDSHHGLYLSIFILATLLGVVMVAALVRMNMKPVRQLSSQLSQAEDDNAQLQREIDAQKPMLHVSYVRKLLSGHVASQEEFAYMMDSLGLSGSNHYYVLYGVAHQQDTAAANDREQYDALTTLISKYLTTRFPCYYYTTLDRSFVILVTYGNDETESLNDLQMRVMHLHDELADSHSLWFHTGVGGLRTQASQLWESYEQARTAARYTARNHIFLPYEFIRKDADNWYYPIEISAKLLHFITTGNQEQAAELLSLLRRENLEERSLSVPLLNLLLSDLRNTLFKARFQIAPPKDEETRARLSQLDERLYEPPTFQTLESNALALSEFFIKATTPSDPIPEVESYLQENYTDPSLCLSKLGERFNISESYLSHLFKNRTGVNFSVYLERLRMAEAARRLQSGQADLSTLYADLGYTNAATFRRAFKKFHGITPSEMRKQG